MNKKTVISATDNAMRKLKVFAGKKKGVVTSATDNTILKLKVLAKKKEGVRSKLVVTAKQLALLAKEKENIRGKLEITAKKLATTAKEAESVRGKLAVTAETLRLRAKQLANTAKEKEDVRNKLAVTAKKLAVTAKEAESVRSRLAITAKEKEGVRHKLALVAKQLAATAKKIGSANKYARSLLEATLDPLVTISPGGKITDVNVAAIKITGVSRKKLVGTDFSNYFTEPKKALGVYKQVFKGGSVTNYPLTIQSQKRKFTDVLYNASVYKNDKGSVLGVLAVARDVTEAKKAKELLVVTAKEKESVRRKLAVTAKEKEDVRNKLVVTAKKLAVTAKEAESVRRKLAVTAKEKEDVRSKLVVVAKKLAVTAKEAEDVRRKLAVTAKEKEDVRNKLVVTAKKLAVTAKEAKRINEELRTLDIAKDEFVSIASHQLRTPLTALKGYAGMLIDGDAGPINDKQREYLVEIKNANDRMIGLITALLNVSRVDLGVFIVEPEQLNLKTVAEGALKDLGMKIDGKKLRIEVNFEKDVPQINADLNIVRMIFQNLFSNAVKYTSSGGKININIKKDGQNILISVADTGYGIPKDVQSKIFTKMFRADNARVKDPDGTGLGLYIIKSTLEKTGGKIWFESVENKGSTFYVTVPLEGMKKKEGTKRLELK